MPWRGLPDGSSVAPLGADECWRLLGNHTFGRICFGVDERVQVVLTAFATRAQHVYFRAAAFGPVARRVLTRPVTLQVDDLQGDQAASWSITVTGVAHPVDDPATLAALWTPVRPAVREHRQDSLWIALTPDDLQGQRFRA
jgi:nitroimidazol reductase NimA-like FMN-containing flavoprotein (pyridoxamine 5'-phosphate oxidase superfamily)